MLVTNATYNLNAQIYMVHKTRLVGMLICIHHYQWNGSFYKKLIFDD